MIAKKKILSIIIICISLLVVISAVIIILDRTGKPKTPVIAFYNINPEY